MARKKKDNSEYAKVWRSAVGSSIMIKRLKANMTRKELAQKINIHSSYLYRLENGEVDFSLHLTIEICKIFKLNSIEELIGSIHMSLKELKARLINNQAEYFKFLMKRKEIPAYLIDEIMDAVEKQKEKNCDCCSKS